ncbi:MAG: PD-(D/E)XK nuclease family protein [Candidatus Pelagibacter sp.]|nr:PD-(D/E)XK nuclease family protein [Candidatus Pelagibacter sp.]
MNRISYSQLSMFDSCPKQWKLNYIDGERSFEPNIFLIFGSAMHEVIQKYLDVMYKHTVNQADELNLEKLLQETMIEMFNNDKEAYGKDPCTKEDLKEFFQNGCDILDFFKKNRGDYFSKKGYELIGCEVPVEYGLQKDLTWVGYLDIVIKDTVRDVITIYDIKTSTMGWNKWMKADENKTQQLLLYKQFYSKMYNHPIDKIEVEYFIVKRKLYENAKFPQKRVQKFSPASGKPSMNKVAVKLSKFINEGFNDDGSYTDVDLQATPSKKACRWCEFKGTEFCDEGVK